MTNRRRGSACRSSSACSSCPARPGSIYEVVWARQLVLVFGNTTQAVSAILTGFFGGMAIGSALGGRLADRVRRPLRMYGLLELVLVVVVIVTPITFRLLHEVYRGAFGTSRQARACSALVRFGLALLALGPATILMGATLPTPDPLPEPARRPPLGGVRRAVRREHASGRSSGRSWRASSSSSSSG